nr:MAG TPA: hypothetical protein [Caudoviricetes sp.]
MRANVSHCAQNRTWSSIFLQALCKFSSYLLWQTQT